MPYTRHQFLNAHIADVQVIKTRDQFYEALKYCNLPGCWFLRPVYCLLHTKIINVSCKYNIMNLERMLMMGVISVQQHTRTVGF